MKIALIPPVPDLERYATLGDVHMALAGLADRPDYVTYYREQADAGKYLILDNGAHETQREGLNIISLLILAERFNASEVVVPDVPGNAVKTIEAARQAFADLETLRGREAYRIAGSPRLMLVPQGSSEEAWETCLLRILDISSSFDVDPVIGIAKHHVETFSCSPRDLHDIVQVHAQARPEVHMLGWPRNLWAIDDLRDADVRSIDSARPFVYAEAGILLEPGGSVPKYPSRSDSYFNESLDIAHDELVMRNIEVFRAAATFSLIL